jgi:hypothetical protein
VTFAQRNFVYYAGVLTTVAAWIGSAALVGAWRKRVVGPGADATSWCLVAFYAGWLLARLVVLPRLAQWRSGDAT